MFSTLAGKLRWRRRSWVFDLNKSDLFSIFVEGLAAKGLGPSRFKVQLGEDLIRARRGGLRAREEGMSSSPPVDCNVCIYSHCECSKEEFNDFLTLYPIPFEYHVILPKSGQTVFDAPPRFVYLGVTLLVVPSSPLLLSCARLMVVSPLSTSSKGSLICVELQNKLDSKSFKDKLRPNIRENPMFQRLGRYPMSVRVFPDPILFLAGLKILWEYGQQRHAIMAGNKASRATRAKTSSLKDDVPFLIVSDDNEVLPNVFELKDATACYLRISSITPPAWKNHLDVKLLDLYDCCYVRQVVVDNAVNRRSRKLLQVIEKLRGEFDVMKGRKRAREEKCEKIMMLESQKWVGYQQSLSTLKSKVTSLKAEKPRLEAVEVSLRKEVEELKQDRREVVSKVIPYAAIELVYSDDIGSLVGRLVSSAILYGRCRIYEQVFDMKEPFNLSKVKGYRSSYKKDHTHANNDLATATFPWRISYANPEGKSSTNPCWLRVSCFLILRIISMCLVIREKDCVIFNPLQRSANMPSLKCLSSFELIIYGTPNLHTTYSHTNLSMCLAFAVVRGFASIHFVECSMAIAKNFSPPGAVGRGPRIVFGDSLKPLEMVGECSCSCVDGILVDGASWSMEVDTGESAKSTTLGAAATGSGETRIVGGLKYSSNIGWNKRSQSSLCGGIQEAEPSESSPPPVPVAPMVSPFLCSDDLKSDTEILERHVSPTPYDVMLTR
nr:hypothetical protein [Tanacetum cinerariifolium]